MAKTHKDTTTEMTFQFPVGAHSPAEILYGFDRAIYHNERLYCQEMNNINENLNSVAFGAAYQAGSHFKWDMDMGDYYLGRIKTLKEHKAAWMAAGMPSRKRVRADEEESL